MIGKHQKLRTNYLSDGILLIKLSAYIAPQRHTLTVRLSSSPRPREIIQIVFSQDPDEDTDIETKMALCVARVDFISHRLSDELIDIVSIWNKSLHQPSSEVGWFSKLRKFDDSIARIIHYSVPVFMTGMSLAILGHVIPNDSMTTPVSSEILIMACRWLLVSFLGLYVFTQLSKNIAGKCYRIINEYNSISPFLLTRGDENRRSKTNEKNKKKVNKFILNAGFTVFLNIIAGIITWKLLK